LAPSRRAYGALPRPADAGEHGRADFPETTAPAIDGASVVLRLKGVKAPRLFAVVWPLTLRATPVRIRRRSSSSSDRVPARMSAPGTSRVETLDPYPDNFDYADIGLFQNLHYGNAGAPLSTWGPKGVPYQVAKAGANVVTVIPCNGVGPEFGVLDDTEETGKILEEIQAYMFWRAGIPDPPLSIGKTAIAAFQLGQPTFLSAWLASEKNRSGSFLKNTVFAVYFLDPRPDAVPGCVTAARTWAQGDQNKRIRLTRTSPTSQPTAPWCARRTRRYSNRKRRPSLTSRIRRTDTDTGRSQ